MNDDDCSLSIVNHLLTLVEEGDEFSPDLYVPGFSAFAELLLEEDKMNVSVSHRRSISKL